MDNILDQFHKSMTIEDVVQIIIDLHKVRDNGYIPALIERGSLNKDERDFYSKLVLVESQTNIFKPFMTSNLTIGLPDINRETNKIELVFNLVIQRNYRGNMLYQINPLLTGNVMEEPYEEGRFVNQIYTNTISQYAWQKILMRIESDIFCLTKVFDMCINEIGSKYYPQYYLVADFEYRSKNLVDIKNIPEGNYKAGKYNISISKNDKIIYVMGSVKIPFVKVEGLHDDLSPREIAVIDVLSQDMKEPNPTDLNNDTELGVICFTPEVLPVLSTYFHIFGLTMIAKDLSREGGTGDYLIDILFDEEKLKYDKVVFWEGEYNKLPTDIKDLIDPFNIRKPVGTLISKAMFAWQLEVDWDFIEKALPSEQLANMFMSRYREHSIDLDISFLIPDTASMFRDYLVKISSISGLDPKVFGLGNPEIAKLDKLHKGDEISFESPELYVLFQKYSYNVLQRIGHE